MKIALIIMKGNYGAIDTNDSSCHGYYIINVSSSTYTLQSELSIDGQVIYSGEMLREGNYLFPFNINSNYYVLQITNLLT